MAENDVQAGGAGSPAEPEVREHVEGSVVTLAVDGELTDAARRPLVRALTDLLLGGAPLQRVDLDLRGIRFMNSAGMAVLVQLQKMAAPRGIEVGLVTPPSAVARPLQLSGLWHRFPVVEPDGTVAPASEPTPSGPDGGPREHS